MQRTQVPNLVAHSLIYSVVAIAITLTTTPLAGQIRIGGCDVGGYTQSCDGGCTQSCGCKSRCPDCDLEVCKVSCEKVEESKTCFKVEYKTICIPKVKLPWDNCCEPRCAETRSVKILVTHKFKCPKCRCKWEVVRPEPCGGQQHAEGDYYYSEPAEPTEKSEEPAGEPNLNEVPPSPTTQRNFRDYFAPANFGRKR